MLSLLVYVGEEEFCVAVLLSRPSVNFFGGEKRQVTSLVTEVVKASISLMDDLRTYIASAN